MVGEVRLAGEGETVGQRRGSRWGEVPGSHGAKSWAGGGRGRPGLLERVLLLVMIRFGVWMAEMGQDRWRRGMEEFRGCDIGRISCVDVNPA